VLALLALGASVADAIADATLCGTFKVNGVMLAAVHSSTFTLTHDTLTSTEELMVIKVVIPSTAKNPRSDPLTYVLTKCASTTAAKAAYPPSATVRVFSVPLTTVTASDTIQLAYLEELGVLETLVGYIGSSYVYSPFKIRQITTGNVGGPIADFSGADYGPYNSAVLTGTNAGAYMFNSYDFRTSDIEIDTGVLSASASDFAKVVVIDEVNEATPLGRAEWIKVVFLFTSEDAKQLEKYDDIVAAYAFAKAAAVTALANAGGVKPTIWNAM
jgi:iron complex transport system substrate-binding protein